MTLSAAVRHGFHVMRRRRDAAVLVWLSNLLMAAPIGLLGVWWWSPAARLPETDVLLKRFDIGVFGEFLFHAAGGAGPVGVLLFAGSLLGALLMSALLYAGLLQQLVDDTSGRPSFVAGVKRWFLPFLGLVAMGAAVALIGTLCLAMLVLPVTLWLMRMPWEPGETLGILLEAAVIVLAILFFRLTLDYSRIRAIVSADPNLFRIWFSSMRFVLRRGLVTIGTAAAFGLTLLAVALVYLGMTSVLPAHTFVLIVLAFVIQQAFALARSSLRVGGLGAAVSVYQAFAPPPPPAPTLAPEPDPVNLVDAQPDLPTS